jgi:hypothetical protein
MKTANIFVRILAALLICAATQLSAEAGLPAIKLVTSFQVDPDRFIDTRPQSINSNGDIAGYLEDIDHNTTGFVRFRNGTQSIIEPPNSEPRFTTVWGINDSGLIAGNYVNIDREGFSFFLSGDTYTDYIVPGALSRIIRGLNNAGNFDGMASFPGTGNSNQPYISVGGDIIFFSVPGVEPPFLTYVYGMNNLNQVVGSYSDEGGNHGYIRNADGTLTFPIDYPGASHTFLHGINDKGWMVGSYLDTEGVYHGFFATSPTRFVAFDLPPGRFTILNGINNRGIICGAYEASGIVYGLIARVTLARTE